MKRTKLLILGFCGSLVVIPAVAAEDGNVGIVSSEEPAVAKQTSDDTGVAIDGRTEDSATDESVAAEGKGESGAGARSSTAGTKKRAGTATAAGFVYDQVKKGNVEIRGATDADIHD